MSLLRLYTIQDRKSGAFEPPVSSENDATAMRWFTRAVDNVPNLQQFPEDFVLLFCGEFNTETGLIVSTETLQHVCSALDCILSKQSYEGMIDEASKVGDDSPVQSSAQGTNSA